MTGRAAVELWGGLECTVARIGDAYRDQLIETGHRDRIEDLDQIAALGIRTLRYPVIWENVAPTAPSDRDWTWHDRRLLRLRDLGIAPVAGLVHHGSGPAYTDLLDRAFPAKLARYAGQAARRYPWIDRYTPVNEPLTTARFSALYGHWYPHRRSYAEFLRTLVNQCRGTVLAMRAIRRVNPAAKLVQTDDLGRTFSTPALAYQADHENERRWLTFDLLFGRVDRRHPWWRTFLDHGVGPAELAFFLDGDGAPDIVGINHYLTSERFLDERLDRYPAHLGGDNGRDRYADVEAVRVPLPAGALGPASRIREAWERYRVPLVVTEVHHGCTRDEQVRWLMEVWNAAEASRREGIDVRAVTIWAMFGTVDWNTLLTRRAGIYEPGSFDIRAPRPRPTLLAAASAALVRTGTFDHPILDRPGWWLRPGRFYGPVRRTDAEQPATRRPILLVGEPGPLTDALVRLAASRGLDCIAALPERAEAAYREARPWAVIDGAEPGALAASLAIATACRRDAGPHLLLSTDRVFDGRLGRAVSESDTPRPSDAAGRDALGREAAIVAAHPDTLLVRAGPLLGPWQATPLSSEVARLLRLGDGGGRGEDRFTPSYIPDLVHVALDLLIDGETGIWHVANAGAASVRDIAAALGTRIGLHLPREPVLPATGPDRSLATGRGALMPPLDSALDRFVRDSEIAWRPEPAIMRVAAE